MRRPREAWLGRQGAARRRRGDGRLTARGARLDGAHLLLEHARHLAQQPVLVLLPRVALALVVLELLLEPRHVVVLLLQVLLLALRRRGLPARTEEDGAHSWRDDRCDSAK